MEVTHLEQTIVAPEEVSVASLISELVSISSFKEDQRAALEARMNGKDALALLLTSFSNSQTLG